MITEHDIESLDCFQNLDSDISWQFYEPEFVWTVENYLEFEKDDVLLPQVLDALIKRWPSLQSLICESSECKHVASHIIVIVNGRAIPNHAFDNFQIKDNDTILFSPFVVGG